MSAFFEQIGALLTDSPGNLIYQIVLAFSVGASLQAAFVAWRSSNSPQNQRTVLGLAAMLAALVVFFLLGLLSWGGALKAAFVLPPLDRALGFVLMTGAIWLWAFPDPSHRPDLAAAILVAVAVVGGGLSLLASPSDTSSAGFNNTPVDVLWQVGTICLLLTGGVFLYIRRTEGFAIGVVFLGLAAVGHLLHLATQDAGDYPGMVRLAYVAAFPLLLTLTQRHTDRLIAAPPDRMPTRQPAEPAQQGTDPRALNAMLALAAQTDSSRANQEIARSVSHAMSADICLVGYLAQGRPRIDIACGYDRLREDYLPAASLENSAVPRLANAIQRGRALRLPADDGQDDLKNLGAALGVKDPKSLLITPIPAAEGGGRPALLLLSPFSGRLWSADDQERLAGLAGALTPVLDRLSKADDRQQSEAAPDAALQDAQATIAQLERRNTDLAQQVEAIALQAEMDSAPPEELRSLQEAKVQSELHIQRLQSELEAAKAGRMPDPQVEQQLTATLRDLAHLQNELAASNQKVLDLERSAGSGRRTREQTEVIASISQELRQPMSSIVGYTDLLLGESVGILGALQRKFIERIKASTERLSGLINDMIQLNTLEAGLSDLKPEAMDLNLIIDNALAYTSSQVREKKISIHLDLPKNVAPVNADREALQQILIHLLQNAGAATPMDGTISLRVQTTEDKGRPFVMIQVTDSGGGIPEDDLPRVFTRLFRADNVLIQGVGDTGVGLSIAKTLTEAQHGRIWVESESGAGATFNVLLPAVGDAVSGRGSKADK